MGLGMFQKHRREREDYALATLAEAAEAAGTDEEKEAAQAALDLAKANAEASAAADAKRDDASAHGVDVPDWEPVDEARGQEPGESPEGSEPGEPGLEKPNGGASREAWATWALAPNGGGKSEEDLKDLGRDAIRDLFA